MSCTKRVYTSFGKAEKSAIELSLQNREIGHPELTPYKCKLCGKYHLTSRSGKTEKEKQIKSGSRKSKLKLIENMNPEWVDLYESLI